MKKIHLAYSDLYNAGDLMNVDIVEKLGSCRVVRTKTFRAKMTAIGGAVYGLQYSEKKWQRIVQHVLRLVYKNKPVFIWGSGFWHDRNPHGLYRDNLQVCALRGAKSRQRLQQLTGKFYDVPLADAGLLIDQLIDVRVEKKYKIGLIPHMSQINEPVMQKMAAMEGVHIIDIRRTPQEVGIDIAQCEVIASSSLHGLIFADALHVPNLHILGEHGLVEGNFKFEDYYSCYGLTDDYCVLSEHIPTFEEIVERYRIPAEAVEEKKRQLLACFPKI